MLRAQLETMEDYNERLLATVYWSLGSIVTVGVLVAGFGWFVNFRLYERDKEALRQELKNILNSEVTKVASELRKNLNEGIERELNATTAQIRRELGGLRIKQLREEAKLWEEKGVKANALRTHIVVIDNLINLDKYLDYGEALDELRTLLSQKIALIDAQIVADFHSVLNRLPAEYSSEVEDLKAMLRDARE